LLARIQEIAGLDFPEERRPDMARATSRAMRRAAAASIEDYLAQLADGRASLSGLIEEVIIGETYFFREPEQFTFLRQVVLPEILARRGPGLRIWSAGCSSGEEPYSLAILLEELGLARGVQVLGTDISKEALARASAGIYQRWSLRGPGAEHARPYLTEHSSCFTLEQKIRNRVRLQQLNLVSAAYPSQPSGVHDFDLILCRNVLIYFDRALVAQVVARLYDSLAEGGWLIAASSDPPLAEHAPFELVATERGLFYRKPDPSRRPGSTPRRSWPAERLPHPPGATESLPESRPTCARRAGEAASGLGSAPPPANAAHMGAREPPLPPSAVSDRSQQIQTLANSGDLRGAAALARSNIQTDPLDPASEYLYAAVLLEQHCEADAVAALRRALYLDGNLVLAHLALGMALRRLRDDLGARRSFMTVLRLCSALDPASPLPLGEGACAGNIAALAAAQLELMPGIGREKHG
jgi:chemotaxis protein methyltransferase CheR